MRWPSLGSFDHEVDGGGQAIPIGRFLFELRTAGGGQRVELGLSSGFGLRPFGFDPGFLLEAVQSRVERALLNLKDFLRDLLDAFGDGPAMFGFERNGFEDEKVESALDEIVRFAHSMTIYTKNCR